MTLEGARALSDPREEPGPFLAEPLPPMRHRSRRDRGSRPLRAASGAGVPAPAARDQRRRLLRRGRGRPSRRARRARAVGRRAAAARRAARRRRGRPRSWPRSRAARSRPGVLGQPVIERRVPDRRAIVRGSEALLATDAAPGLDRRPRRARGTIAVSGTVPGVSGDVVRTVTYSRVSAKHRLAAWVRLLALTAAYPERPFAAATVGRAPGRRGGDGRADPALGARRREPPRGCARAARDTVDLYDRGMREPLPLYCLTSAAYAEAAAAGGDPGRRRARGVDVRVELRQGGQGARAPARLGGVRTLDDLLAEPPRADEEGHGWECTETHPRRSLRAADVGRPARARGDRADDQHTEASCRSTSAAPLPTGVTVLEASAGTGKTYTIAALAARYVAEGIPLDRAAARHVHPHGHRRASRAGPRAARQRRARPGPGARGGAADGDDDRSSSSGRGHRRGGSAPPRSARARARRLRRGDDRDHPWLLPGGARRPRDRRRPRARRRLRRGPQRPRRGGRRRSLRAALPPRGDTPPFGRAQAAEIARIAIENPATPIVPARGEVPEMRRRLAIAVREELEPRKRRMAVMTYDDLLTRLDARSRATAARRGRAAPRALRASSSSTSSRTPTRSSGTSCAAPSATAAATLVLIGDPKQAIYAFRGADVYAYLEAAQAADAQATLEINWRSDQGLIDAYDALFGGAKLGHEGIVYRRVRAADANQTPRLTGAPTTTPLRIRVVHRDRPRSTLTRKGFASNGSRRASTSPRTSPADLVALLSSPARDRDALDDGAPLTPRARAPRPRRGARPHEPQRGTGPRGARGRRHPRGDQRRRQRLRHAAGPRVAAPARGARAPHLDDARALGRAHLLPRLVRRSRSPPPTRTPGRTSTAAFTTGRGCCALRGVAVADGDDHARRGSSRSGSCARPTASASSPTCATSASSCTPRHRASRWARRR